MPVSPEWVVAPPPTVPPLHSLLASAPPLSLLGEPEVVGRGGGRGADSDRWEGGLVFQPELCQEAQVWAPCRLSNEVQSITVDATAGTWSVQFGVDVSPPLPFNVTAFALQQALEALPSVGAGNVVVSGGPGGAGGGVPYLVEFVGVFAETNVPPLVVTSVSLSGGGASVAQQTVQAAGELIEKSVYVPTDAVFYEPPVLEVPFTCSTFHRRDWGEYQRVALENLFAGQSKALEAELWAGVKNPSNPSLVRSTPNDDDHVLNPGGAAAPRPVGPQVALMLLSQALANCGTGARGMIHATAALAERWMNSTAVSSQRPQDWCLDPELFTGCRVLVTGGRGDIIVSGSGYPGTGPVGQPPPGPDEVWAFATSMVGVRLGEPRVFPDSLGEALDRATNTVTVRAERTAAAVWNLCCSFAVLVDLCGG